MRVAFFLIFVMVSYAFGAYADQNAGVKKVKAYNQKLEKALQEAN